MTRLLVLDFDGVLTDNRVIVSEDGKESVVCSRADGIGIAKMRGFGVRVIVCSKEPNPVVAVRCQKLKVECVQAVDDKIGWLTRFAAENGYDRSEVAYVGNDEPDVECLLWAQIGFAPADSEPAALAAADIILDRRGGYGAVREVCERLSHQLSAASR